MKTNHPLLFSYPVLAFHIGMIALLTLFDADLYRGFHAVWVRMGESNFLLEEITKYRHWEFIKQWGSAWAALIAWLVIWEYGPKHRPKLPAFFFGIVLAWVGYELLQHSVGKIRPEMNAGVPFYYPFPLGWSVSGGLSFPSGHSSFAMWLGFRLAMGRVLVTLDGDRQNDPADMPRLVERVLSGQTDMANGFRANRQDTFTRRAASTIANTFRNLTTGRSVRDVGCSIRAFRPETVANLPQFRGVHRFIPTLVAMQGFRIEEWPVNHRPREKGTSKYTISNRLWVGILDVAGIMWLRSRGFHREAMIATGEVAPGKRPAEETIPPESTPQAQKETV